MTTLMLLRHAKSSWADSELVDHDRPLSRRGERAARRMAEHLRLHGIRPALVLCSPAERAYATLELVRPALGAGVDVSIEDLLYGAGATELLRRLRSVAASVTPVMVIGHNPGLQDLALSLAGEGDPGMLSRLRRKFPTGALATLEAAGAWDTLAPRGARLVSLVVPRELF